MNIELTTGISTSEEFDSMIVWCFEDGQTAHNVPEDTKRQIGKIFEWREFKGGKGSIYRFQFEKGRRLLVGLGKVRNLSIVEIREAAAFAASALSDSDGGTWVFPLPLVPSGEGVNGVRGKYRAIIEGIILAGFKFDKYKTGDKTKGVEKYLLPVNEKFHQDALIGLQEGKIIGGVVNEVRTMVMEPSDKHRTGFYMEKLREMSENYGFSLEMLNKTDIKNKGMGGLMAVNRGAQDPPLYAVMKYDGRNDGSKPIVLVGKGVLFDSGGLCLKSSRNFPQMRYDMASAAAVTGFIGVASKLKWPLNLVVLTPVTENMIAPNSMKPGEIITMLSGKTVEVVNTDAEGRLILADALADALSYDPEVILQFCTLSGGINYVFGERVTPVLGTADDWKDRLKQAGEKSGEYVCCLPLIEDLEKKIKGKTSDLKNLGGNSAEPMTAALFLKQFTGNIPWLHIDIVASAWASESRALAPEGATGVGVMLLSYLLGPGF